MRPPDHEIPESPPRGDGPVAPRTRMNIGVLHALLAAVLFGVGTPAAKFLVGEINPVLLGGLLYLGSGIGLACARLLRDGGWSASGLSRSDRLWLLGAILAGGVVGPVALMTGLHVTDAASASLLLNLESVFTAALAWLVFREPANPRVVAGMIAIVAGGMVLAWPASTEAPAGASGPVLIGMACLCWALDNNLTRRVSGSDALFVASTKGLVAGTVNCAIAWLMGAPWPATGFLAASLGLGLASYGVSLVLFVLALRELGAARTGAYFSIAPFVGAAAALVAPGGPTSDGFWVAAALMGLGLWLHLTERHQHTHVHEALEHTHHHSHDEHHPHAHDFPWDARRAHTHPHRHEPLTHRHEHYPDIHHQHPHPREAEKEP